MSVNQNSSSSYGQIDRERKIKRIMVPFQENPDKLFADFEIVKMLGLPENDVQPPISWALSDGLLLVSGQRKVSPFGREVRCCRLNKDGIKRKVEEQIALWERG